MTFSEVRRKTFGQKVRDIFTQPLNEVSREVIVNNDIGLHCRAASEFVNHAIQYDCKFIFLEKDEKRVRATSLVNVLSMGITGGMVVRIRARGKDAAKAVDDLEVLLKKFPKNYV